ncbi:MAG: CRTAC1 family protein [Acidobacteriota bacterium]
MRKLAVLICIAVASAGVTLAQVKFTDVTTAAGIRFQQNNGAFGKKYLPETMGSGAAFLDYNGDGWLDIFLANGTNWPDGKKKGPSYPALYRNNKNGTFTDVTRQAGLAVEFYGVGVTAADYDNDGDCDLFVSSLGPDKLFQNQGNGTFKEISKSAGISQEPAFGTSAAFLDYDRDGLLDLFVANYVRWSRETDIFCSLDGEKKSYCTPQAYHGASPRLYHNKGDGTFEDVTKKSGLFDETNKGLGVLVFDYNNDGWPDIMMANDTQPNKLWQNMGNGTFQDVGVIAGIAFSEDGVARGAMGIDAADYDRSGYQSVIIGNFSNEMISLYHNEKNGFFIDDAPTSTVGPDSLLSLTFGCFFFDFNLDGYLDIYAANGHVENTINEVQKKVTYQQPAQLFENIDGRQFKEVAKDMGADFVTPRVARAAAYGDFDNDGDLDILLTTCGGPAKLFRNDGGNSNNWVAFDLQGVKSNRDAIGALVRVKSGGSVQSAEVKTGGSYCSQSQLRMTFGLGKVQKVDSVEILWPSGEKQVLNAVPINRIMRVVEAQGIEGTVAGTHAAAR